MIAWFDDADTDAKKEAIFKAMRAGKHVLTEKLMGQTVSRCKEMGRLAEESQDTNGNPIVFAVGHQRHYSVLYANAVDQIRRGLLGDLHHIRAQWHRGNLPGNDSWCPPMPEAADYNYDVFDAAIMAAEKSGDNKAKAALVAAHPLYAKLRSTRGALKNAKGGDIDDLKKKVAQIEKILEQARKGRLFILGKMAEAIDGPREQLSPHAPRIESIKIDQEKIGAVIGKGGETIRGL